MLAPRDIAPGQDYAEQIISAIEACPVLVLILSESSNQSQYVRNEVERAIAKRKVVIPFRIHNVTPSRSLEFFISNAQWIDAWQTPIATTMGALVAAIGSHISARDAGEHTLQAAMQSIEASPLRQEATPRQEYATSYANLMTVWHPSNLPGMLTPFIGRARELADLLTLLRDLDVRLVTIVAPGGMGKTRLALATAAHVRDEEAFPKGVAFVALASVLEPIGIDPALADTLGLPLGGTNCRSSSRAQLLDYLREKELLLVLDNCEHLRDAVAELVGAILAEAPGVTLLATSRERLGLRAEQVMSLDGR